MGRTAIHRLCEVTAECGQGLGLQEDATSCAVGAWLSTGSASPTDHTAGSVMRLEIHMTTFPTMLHF